MPFSVVIPCYQSPQYLDLCLHSALSGQESHHEYIVVFDGHYPLYEAVHKKYAAYIQAIILPQNAGLPTALNRGVWQASNPWLLLVNEDNVFPKHWDRRLKPLLDSALILSIDQIEPLSNVYDFPVFDFGKTAAEFDFQAFQSQEPDFSRPEPRDDGRLFPFVLEKKHYMRVGGFDQAYPSPHYCDFDFFLKLEMHEELRFQRTKQLHFYHFGQKSTTNPDGNPVQKARAKAHFEELANQARQLFESKWGITALRAPNHSLMPQVRFQNGIRFQHKHEAFKLATIVNFCTNEARFIDRCLAEAQKFSSQIIVPVCDHFFDGQAEDMQLLQEIIARHPEVQFVGFAFETSPRPPWYWPSLARVVGLRHLDTDIESVLFLDADEIVDGIAMHQWLSQGQYRHCSALSLANYWYFRESHFQADVLEDSAILIQRSEISEEAIMDPMERISIYEQAQGPKQRFCKGHQGQVMVHHYSWVRSKAEMLRKVQAWSHREDRDWIALVEAEFEQDFSGTDFVHGYHFKTVPAFFS